MTLVAYAVGSWALGAVPFALILARSRSVDLLRVGSGNPGATNLAREVGFQWGVLAFVLDAAKGYVPVAVAPLVGDSPWLPLLGGSLAVLGHCFSPYLRFRGGKGVATTAGVLMGLHPILFLALVSIWGLVLAVSRDVGIASVVAALAGGGVGGWMLVSDDVDLARRPVAWLLVTMGGLIVIRHRSNLVSYFHRGASAEVEG